MRTPVFIFDGSNSGKVGNGNYHLIACFVKKNVHVPFSIYCHSENEYNEGVGNPSQCDGSCHQAQGHLEDWSKKRCESSYSVKQIIKAANTYKLRKKWQNAQLRNA
jgi:hypothetical protein